MKQSGDGCHINGNFMGVLSYADDITLICPSILGLNKRLNICNTFKKTIVFYLIRRRPLVLSLET